VLKVVVAGGVTHQGLEGPEMLGTGGWKGTRFDIAGVNDCTHRFPDILTLTKKLGGYARVMRNPNLPLE